MTFQFFLYAGCACFFLGSAIGSILCIIFAAVFHKKFKTFRASSIYIFLSFVIIFCTLCLLFCKIDFSHLQKIDYIWAASIFFLGLLCASFFKTVLPITIALYSLTTIFSARILYKNYERLPKSINLLVAENYVELNNSRFSLQSLSSSNENAFFSVAIRVNKLNNKYLFPLPRLFFDSMSIANSSHQKIVPEFESKVNLEENILISYLCNNYEVFFIDIPKAKIFPSLYSIEIAEKNGKIKFKLIKTL